MPFGQDNILVQLGANVTGLTEGMDKAQAKVQSSTLRIGENLGGLGEAIERVKVPFIALMGIMAGGELFKEAIGATREMGSALERLAEKTGIAADELSRYEFAANMMDVQTVSLETGFKKLAVSMQNAGIEPTMQAALAFRALGIPVKDASGHLRNLETVMLEVANKFQNMEDGAGKTALAMDLFGRSGADLVPILNVGAAGIEKLKQKSDELGATMTETQVAIATEYDDAMKGLEQSLKGIERTIATAVIPSLTALANAFLSSRQTGEEVSVLAEVLGGAFRLLATAILFVKNGFDVLYATAKNVLVFLIGGVEGLANAFHDLEHGHISKVAEDFAVANDWIKAKWGETNDNLALTVRATTDQIAKMWDGLGPEDLGGKEGTQKKVKAPEVVAAQKPGEDPMAWFNEAMHKSYLEAQRFTDQVNAMFFRMVQENEKRMGTGGIMKGLAKSQSEAVRLAASGIADMTRQLEKQERDQKRVTEEIKRQWIDVFATIREQALAAWSAVVRGTMTAHAAMRNMIRQLEWEFIQAEERKLEAKAAAWLASKGITAESALQEIAAYAATAAAGAWAALASIPYVGPFLAPTVAAATLAGVIALGKNIASAEGGYDIPPGVNPVTQLHAREMVLPSRYADVIRGMAGSGGGGAQHVHHWNVQAMDRKTFADHMMSNRDALTAPIQALFRENKIRV